VPELCPYGRSDPGRPLHAPRPWSTTPSARGLWFCQPSAADQATTDQDSLARLSPSRLLTVRKRLLLPTLTRGPAPSRVAEESAGEGNTVVRNRGRSRRCDRPAAGRGHRSGSLERGALVGRPGGGTS